jgi:hypothetical protein
MKALVIGTVLTLAAVASANPLKVEIKPSTLAWSPNAPVSVTMRVTNTSTTMQSPVVWSCSWQDNVRSSDKDIGFDGTVCTKNGEMKVDIAPGAFREWSGMMRAAPAAKPGPHAMTITFMPRGATTGTASAPVTITVGAAASAGALTLQIKPSTLTWKTKQSPSVWLCSWWENFTSSDKDLALDAWGCDKNFPRGEDIEPGKSHEWKGNMIAAAGAKLGAHELTMMFKAEGASTGPTSNKVTITVVK